MGSLRHLALGVALCALTCPAAAEAKTYCVSDPACPAGGIAEPSVAAAVDRRRRGCRGGRGTDRARDLLGLRGLRRQSRRHPGRGSRADAGRERGRRCVLPEQRGQLGDRPRGPVGRQRRRRLQASGRGRPGPGEGDDPAGCPQHDRRDRREPRVGHQPAHHRARPRRDREHRRQLSRRHHRRCEPDRGLRGHCLRGPIGDHREPGRHSRGRRPGAVRGHPQRNERARSPPPGWSALLLRCVRQLQQRRARDQRHPQRNEPDHHRERRVGLDRHPGPDQ